MKEGKERIYGLDDQIHEFFAEFLTLAVYWSDLISKRSPMVNHDSNLSREFFDLIRYLFQDIIEQKNLKEGDYYTKIQNALLDSEKEVVTSSIKAIVGNTED